MSSLPEPYYCFNEGATLDETVSEEPTRTPRWSQDDQNYYILETWCSDVINRNAEIDNLPLHRLRRNIIDVSRWIPGGFRDHATVDFEPYY